ncbi:MAG: hypothetical protein K2Q10_11145 [Rhodospirillales bacterium]|nr:hypothetical protein [Rhodospirillales bacterium]
MGGSSGSSETIQKADPWAGQQPYLPKGFERSDSLFFSPKQTVSNADGATTTTGGEFGKGIYAPQFYNGSTVAAQSNETQLAQQMMTNRALNGSPVMKSAQQQLYNTMNGDFLSANPISGYLGDIASGAPLAGFDTLQSLQGGYQDRGADTYAAAASGQMRNAATGLAGGLASQRDTGPAGMLFGGEAAGGMLGANPYNTALFEAATRPVVEQFRMAVAPQIDANMAAHGRYGSGAHALAQGQAEGRLASALGDTAANIFGQDYARERGFQENAKTQLQGASDQAAARQLQATGLLGQFSGGDINTRLAGAQGLSAADRGMFDSRLQAGQALAQTDAQARAQQIQAAGAIGQAWDAERQNQMRGMLFAPQMAQADYQDISMLSNVGQSKEAYDQSLINEQIQRWNYNQQLPVNMLAQYNQLIAGNYGSTTTTTQPGGGNNAMMGGLGGAMAGGALGYGAGAMLGSYGLGAAAFSGPAAPFVLGGAALGGLLGAF